MAELLLFAWDHSTQSTPTPSTEQLAALPKLYDLITFQPDGWNWGLEELAHPWFRVVAWPAHDSAAFATFLSPLLPQLDINMNPTTYWQYRGFFLNIAASPANLKTWFADTARATQRLVFANAIVTPASLSAARAAVAIPAGLPA